MAGYNHLVISCSSDVQNCGKVQILKLAAQPAFLISGSSDVQNCVKMEIFHVVRQPFRHFVVVARQKLWWNADFWRSHTTISSFRGRWTSKTVAKWISIARACADVAGMFHAVCVRRCGKTSVSRFLNARRCSETRFFVLLDSWTLSQDWVRRSRESVAKRKFSAPGIAPRTVLDVSMLRLSTWNHECRRYIVFRIVARCTVLDVSMLTNFDCARQEKTRIEKIGLVCQLRILPVFCNSGSPWCAYFASVLQINFALVCVFWLGFATHGYDGLADCWLPAH